MIMFAVKEARNQLENKRFVITLRKHRRKTGRNYYNYYRGDIKRGIVSIIYLSNMEGHEENLKSFVAGSGFKTLEEWLEKAKDARFLYKVKLIEKFD